MPREADHNVTIVVTERMAVGDVEYRSTRIESIRGITLAGKILEIKRRRSDWETAGTNCIADRRIIIKGNEESTIKKDAWAAYTVISSATNLR